MKEFLNIVIWMFFGILKVALGFLFLFITFTLCLMGARYFGFIGTPIYSLSTLPNNIKVEIPIDSELEAIQRARDLGIESKLPIDKIGRDEWVYRVAKSSTVLRHWEVELQTATSIPIYYCVFVIKEDGMAVDALEKCGQSSK